VLLLLPATRGLEIAKGARQWLSETILNDFSTVLAWPEVAAVETAAAAAAAAAAAEAAEEVAEVARSPAVG